MTAKEPMGENVVRGVSNAEGETRTGYDQKPGDEVVRGKTEWLGNLTRGLLGPCT